MEFRILGPLEAVEEGVSLPLGPEKQRALLAVLLLSANRTVSEGQIVAGVWGEVPPPSARKAVHTYVSRLRRILPEGVLRTHPPGYLLQVAAGGLDLDRFEQLRADGRRALVDGDPAAASATLGEALRLWRGPALAEFASEPFSGVEAGRLEELRIGTLEERIEADLALGRHGDVVPELEALAVGHPLRERLGGLLMVALYRSDRQAEALAAYRGIRKTLVDDLGIEPGPVLQNLERAILRQDPSLLLPAEAIAASAGHPRPATHPVRKLAQSAGTFVGRQTELELLSRALERATAGEGSLVLIAGEPGIGKTRLASEFAQTAADLGVRVLIGRCSEREGVPSYWPWLQIIRTYVAECPRDRLRHELGHSAAPIAGVLPEVGTRIGSVDPAPPLADERQSQFRLLDSIASFLMRVGEREPLVLLLEDLHAADAGSLALLEVVAREVPDARLTVIGTYRDIDVARGHPLWHTLAELSREQLFERLALRGLTEGDVGTLVAAVSGADLDEDRVRALHDRTSGNPLFLTEVLRLLAQEGRLAGDAETLKVAVPEGVRAVIGRRLDRLSAPCIDVLRVASVAGPEFRLDALERLVGEHTDEVLARIEEALAARVVEEVRGSPGRFRFAHPLIRETIEAELSTTRRVRMHARVAVTLEEIYGDNASLHAPELAYHFAEAETVSGSESLTRYARLAGEQAYAAHAYDDAIAWFQRALAAREGEPIDDEKAELLLALIRSEFLGRDPLDLGQTLDRMQDVFEYYVEQREEELAVRLAAHPIPPVWGQTGVPALLARALALADPQSLEEGQILANIGRFAGTNDGDYARAVDAFERSLAIARKHSDEALERRVLALCARVDHWFLRWDDCTLRSQQALDLAVAAGDQQTELYARAWLGRDAAIRGDSHTAQAETAASLALAERLGERYWLATARLNRFWLAFLTGDWPAARRFSDAGLRAQPRDTRNLAVRALLEYELDNHDAGATYIDRLLEATYATAPGSTIDYAETAAGLALLGRMTARADRVDEAVFAGRTVLDAPIRIPIFDLLARVGLAVVAVEEGDAAAAREQYAALRPQQGTAVIFVGIAADRLLGMLALTTGRTDDACEHFEAALDFCERAGYMPERARTGVEYALALRRRGDVRRAARHIGAAEAAARELGMCLLEERADAARS
jgi:DNA-binding SARP family transcriptional activator/tetratricopeptide (TPR) repeat protein